MNRRPPLRRICRLVAVSLAASAALWAPSGFAQIDVVDQAQQQQQQQQSPRIRSAAQQVALDSASSVSAEPVASPRYQPDRIEEAPSTGIADKPVDQAAPVRRVAVPSEFEVFVSQIADEPLRRFGTKLIIPGARDFTTPPNTTVPDDYRLNSGDQLVVGLTGSVQANNLRLTVDPEGRIFVPRVGAIHVGGVRYADLQSLIASQVSRQYRDFRVAVSMGGLHGITVYVTGFAAAPGSYTVSSLSTLINAVLAAGGPSAGGSFRSIQLRRGGQLLSDFDLYDLLLKGDKSADVILQNGDVIFIAPAGAQVAVIGSVNSQAIFEARGNETLQDFLLYAGGINTVADSTRLLVLNPVEPGGWQQLTPPQVAAKIATRSLIVRVLSGIGIAQPMATQPALVTVGGEVAHPGRYYVQPGTSLGAVIEQAGGLTAQAFPFGASFTRESIRRDQKINYERAIADMRLSLSAQMLVSATQRTGDHAGQLVAIQSIMDQLAHREVDGRVVFDIAPEASALPGDLIVQNNDAIYVPPRPVVVSVFGSVPNPANFQFDAGVTIGAYVARAGGVLRLGSRSEIFVVRANGMLLAPKHGTFRGSILKQRVLPGDLIFVPIASNRGEFWQKLRDIMSSLFQGGIAAATVVAVTK